MRHVLDCKDDPRGIKAAKAAGLFACAITTKFSKDDPQLLAAGPDIILDSFDEYETAVFED